MALNDASVQEQHFENMEINKTTTDLFRKKGEYAALLETLDLKKCARFLK